jgi:hypothetical protein
MRGGLAKKRGGLAKKRGGLAKKCIAGQKEHFCGQNVKDAGQKKLKHSEMGCYSICSLALVELLTGR